MRLPSILFLACTLFFVACNEDDDPQPAESGTPSNGSSFSLVLTMPTSETQTQSVNWQASNATSTGISNQYDLQASELATSSQFMVSGFNYGLGSQTVSSMPIFQHNGVNMDLIAPLNSSILITFIDSVNNRWNGTYSYEFVKYFNNSMGTGTISRTGTLQATFTNVPYN